MKIEEAVKILEDGTNNAGLEKVTKDTAIMALTICADDPVKRHIVESYRTDVEDYRHDEE